MKLNDKKNTCELQQDKTNKMTCAPDSDRHGHLLASWRHLGSLATHWPHSEDYDQTGRMPRLIWVFAGHTYHLVGFVMLWLLYSYQKMLRPVSVLLLYLSGGQLWSEIQCGGVVFWCVPTAESWTKRARLGPAASEAVWSVFGMFLYKIKIEP